MEALQYIKKLNTEIQLLDLNLTNLYVYSKKIPYIVGTHKRYSYYIGFILYN